MDACTWNIPALGYGSKWTRGRRLFHGFFNMGAVTGLGHYYTRRFLFRLAGTLDDFHYAQLYSPPSSGIFVASSWLTLILRSAAGPLIMEITHSLETKPQEETFIQIAERAMEYTERGMVPGEFLVNTFSSRFVCT